MKKSILFLLLLFLIDSLDAIAQISVADFYYAENDLTARTHSTSVEDQNGIICALIKVETTEKGLWSFDVGILGVTKTEMQNTAHPDEIWVYVPYGVRRISIHHDKLGELDRYIFPCSIDKGCTYVMKLKTGKVIKEVRMQYLVFQITPSNARLEVNNMIWPVATDGTAKKYVEFGTYTYHIQAQGYYPETGRVTVDNPDNTISLKVSLRPKVGWIEVAGDGSLKDASVYLVKP